MHIMNVNSVTNADGTAAVAAAQNTARSASTNFSGYMDQASSGYGDYLEGIFQKASDTYNVSIDLLKAMAKAESNFHANATSQAGAMGIMQLMPATAASLGVTDAYDAEQNIMGGAKYISQLLQQYNGNLSYAIAAYNAGSGNVNKYGGIPPFKETQNYVAKVLQYMQEGVTIPDSSGTVAASASQSSGQTQTDSSSGSVLEDIINKYFDYDDYLEFLQLFTKIIYEKISGKKLDTQTSQADQADSSVQEGTGQDQTVQPEPAEQPEPVKQLTMRIKDANGNVSTYRQGDAADSDAYKAYQNMIAGSKNRVAVYLTKTAEQTDAV